MSLPNLSPRRLFSSYLTLLWGDPQINPEKTAKIKEALATIDGLSGLYGYGVLRVHRAGVDRAIIRLSWHNQAAFKAALQAPEYKGLLVILRPLGLEVMWNLSAAGRYWRDAIRNGTEICKKDLQAPPMRTPRSAQQNSGRHVIVDHVAGLVPSTAQESLVMLFALGSAPGAYSPTLYEEWAPDFIRTRLAKVAHVTDIGCYTDRQSVAAIVLMFPTLVASYGARGDITFRLAKDEARRHGFDPRDSAFVDHAQNVARILKEGFTTVLEVHVSH